MNRWNERFGAARSVLCSSAALVLGAAGAQVPEPAAEVDRPTRVAALGDAADAGVLRRVRDAFISAGDYDAALGSAEQVVEAARGFDDPKLADDIARLARIQAELENFDSAELQYLEALELIRDAEGEFSITLADVYRGLGLTYVRARRFAEAVTALEQAQHVVQRNLGLHNVSQTPLLDDLTTAYLGLGETATAGRLQSQRLENAVRSFGEHDPRVIPFRYRLANYYEQSRLRGAAREQYQEVVATLETLPEADEQALLAPLRQLMRIEMLFGDGDEARTRLAGILERDPGIEAPERARSLAALGDWAVVHEDLESARGYYSRAYTLLDDAPDEREVVFGEPVMLDFIAPLTAVDRATRSDPYAFGTILLEFDVSADGRAANVRAVRAQPPGIVDGAYMRRVRETHFRPRIVDGVPRETNGVRFTHYFRYYVEEEE